MQFFFLAEFPKVNKKQCLLGSKVFFSPLSWMIPEFFEKKCVFGTATRRHNCTADSARIGHLAASPAAWAITIASVLWLRPSQASQGIRVLEKRFATPCVYIHVYIYMYIHIHI